LKTVNFEVRRVNGMTLDAETVQRISAKVREGALVAVMCNLVADAQALAETLNAVPELAGKVDLFHARYRFKDRDEIEKRVLATYGKQAERAADKGRVIVATQVIEQSLDLDFDWLITQICPIELLIQRVGRLWRHDRPARFGVSEAECLVLTPEGDDFGLHALVYDTPKWLWRARDLIEREPKAEFPSVNRKWLREAYSDENWSQEPSALEAAHEKYEVDQLTKRSRASQLLSAEQDGTTPFSDTEGNAALLTRDGQMSLKVIPVLESAPRRTLEGEPFPADNDFHLDELLDQNAVNAPYSWMKFLPKPEEDFYFLEMQPRTDGSWATTDGRFVYDAVSGLKLVQSHPL
jgi:CRISPR-associated endonuclease/helicase Cas3